MKTLVPFILLTLGLVTGVAHAGAIGGPKHNRTTIMAWQTHTYSIVFEKGVDAEIIVNGDGSTDLDCTVYDSNGNLIDSDVGPTDLCVLSWTPKWKGKFTLKVRNGGGEPNEYTVKTN